MTQQPNNQTTPALSERLQTVIGDLERCSHLRWITPNESWQSSDRRYSRRYDYNAKQYIEANPELPIAYSGSYGDWTPWPADKPLDGDAWFIPEYASGSDYSGNLVEQCNFKVIREQSDACEFEDADIIEYSGGHGTFALAIRVGALDVGPIEDDADLEDRQGNIDSLIETITGLEDYPLADESELSEMENNAQNEAWEDYARSEFKTELTKYFRVQCDALEPEQWAILADMLDDTDWLSDSFADTIAWDLQNYSNACWENEQGDSMYLDVERLVSGGLTPDKHWPDIADKQRGIEQDIIREIHKQGTVYVLTGGLL